MRMKNENIFVRPLVLIHRCVIISHISFRSLLTPTEKVEASRQSLGGAGFVRAAHTQFGL